MTNNKAVMRLRLISVVSTLSGCGQRVLEPDRCV
jgi:hypothetical protein